MYDMDYDMFHYSSYEKSCAVMTTDSTIGIGKWIKRSCNDTNGYVCLRNIDASLPNSTKPPSTEYVKIFNDSIKFVSQQMNWDAAKKNCERDGAKLASLRNDWSQTYAELLALNNKGPMWIGMNKNETGGYFRYIDGWRIVLPKWDRWEPATNRPCVFINEEGKWKTAKCNENMTSICMTSTDVPPTESSVFPGYCPDDPESSMRRGSQVNTWLAYRGYCYLFNTERVEWPHASANCMRHGGHLASIESPFEQQFIESNILTFQDSHNSFWVGLYKTHKGMWLWLDKTAMDYTNWREMDSTSGSYGAVLVKAGVWMTGQRWHEKGYICKTAKVLPNMPQTTVKPVVDPKTRGHTILAIVLVIGVIAIGAVITLFLFKKSGRPLPIPEKLSAFDNPLFFNNERSQPNLVDTNKLVANAEEENTGPIIDV